MMTALPESSTGGLGRHDPLDGRELRSVFGAFVTGVTVITTVDDDGRCWGLTANSFTSVSLDPPLISWNQSINAPSHQVFRNAKRFAVNILSEAQVDMSKRFSSAGADKFAGVSVRKGLGDVPLLDGCTAYLECVSAGRFEGGDHAVFLGRVERMERHPRAPLVFGHGRYLTAQPHEYAEVGAGGAKNSQLRAIRAAMPVLMELSAELKLSTALSVWGSHGPTVVRWEQPANDPLQAELPAGQVCRLLSSATGIAWAAFAQAPEAAFTINAELQAPLAGSPSTPEEAELLLSQTRRHGVARVVGSPNFVHRYGALINAAAAPVYDAGAKMILSLTVVGDAATTDMAADGDVCRQLSVAAAKLSKRLGFEPA